MLDIGWVFAGDQDFRELIVSLSKSPYESIFSTDLVLTLYEIFSERYTKAILIWCCLPYLLYFLFTVIFYTWFTSGGINSCGDNEQEIAKFMGLIIICLDLYFLFHEFV